MGRALPPVAEREDDLREEPSSAPAALLLPRRDVDVAPRVVPGRAAVAGSSAGAGAAPVLDGVFEDGAGRGLPVLPGVVVEAEVLEAREAAAQVRRPARHVQEDVGQVPALHHHMVHLHACVRAAQLGLAYSNHGNGAVSNLSVHGRACACKRTCQATDYGTHARTLE